MPHAFLIAAIFVPYAALMVGLGIYIWRTGHHREIRHDQDDRDGDAEARAVA